MALYVQDVHLATSYYLSGFVVAALLSGACNQLSKVPECIVSLDCAGGQICSSGRCLAEVVRADAEVPGLDRDGAALTVVDGGTIIGDGGFLDARLSNPLDAGPPLPDAGPSCNEPSCNRCDDRFPNALMCETFDEGLSAWFPFLVGRGSVDLTQERYHLGGQALNAMTPAGGGEGSLRRELSPAIESGEFYMRVEAYVPSGPTLVSAVPLFFVRSRRDGRKTSIDLGVNDIVQLIHTGAPFVGSSPGSFRRDRWVCLEAHVRLDGSDPGLLELWVDGTRVDATSGSNIVAPAGGYDDIKVGAASFSNAEDDVEVYLDEIVLSRTGPIGCES